MITRENALTRENVRLRNENADLRAREERQRQTKGRTGSMAKMTTNSEDRDFWKMFTENVAFDASRVLLWVEDNFRPEHVYSTELLARWAEENGYALAPDN